MNSKFSDKIEKVLMPVAGAISNNRYLLAIRDGFMLSMPLLIIGAMSLLLANLPIPGYSDFMKSIFGPGWDSFFRIPFNCTMNIMAIFVIVGVAYSLARHYEIEEISTSVIALVSFFIITPFSMDFIPQGSTTAYKVTSIIPLEWIGSKGLFVGMLTAIFTTEIVKVVVKRGWTIKMPDGVPPTVAKAFSALIPGAIALYVFNLVRLGFSFTSFGTVHEFIFKILQQPLTSLGDTYVASIVANFFMQLFWVFGIHGPNVVGAVTQPIWLATSADNLAAFQAGMELPHILTQQYEDLFIQLGGSGATLSLCLAMMFICKSEQCKKLGRLAIIPGLFNINEPIVFGLPIVLNPIMMIPFIIVPLVLTTICYASMSFGLVPKPSGVIIPWTTPPIIGGFIICGVRGAILQIVEMIVSFLIYLPFIKMVDKQYHLEEKANDETKEFAQA
ncbi:PTS cellobiose transporter subunit IIC [Clostridium saccharoperbutylacetonicum]